MKTITLAILYCLFSGFPLSLAEIKPPNYDFKIDQLDKFLPGKIFPPNGIPLKSFQKYKKTGNYMIYKFEIRHQRYKFPLFIQVINNGIVDIFANLPTYFLHDVFLQSLVNRMGKQKKFYRVEGNALYLWNDKGIKHIYSGTCTITCFPLYYSAQQITKKGEASSFEPLLKQFIEK